jgi:glycosyltransferase involved in cell wall biosynthesis
MDERAGRRIRAHVLSPDPLVIIGAVEHGGYLGPAPLLSPMLVGRRYWLLLRLHWSMERPHLLAKLAAAYARHAEQFPENHIFYLCNTERELLAFQRQGIPSLLCNHNIFVSDEIFDVQPEQPKEFDAVYNARPAPYKRQELGRDIARLALVYYVANDEDRDYLSALKKRLPNATFVNEVEASRATTRLGNAKARDFVRETFEQKGRMGLRPDAVARWYNRARVGLCLSAAEGAMYASMEYLLCGLPIVSTPSRGGRDFYFDPEFCVIAPADSKEVADAVASLARRRIPPDHIRAKTLAKLMHDREIFLRFVQAIYDENAAERDARQDWRRTFVHALTADVPLDWFREGAKPGASST